MGKLAQVAMGMQVAMRDGLRNLVSGLGGANDKSKGATYTLTLPTQPEIEACYRSTWLGRKIHDIPALDMTREWRGWQAEDDQIEAIENEEKRLQLRAKARRAMVLSKLFGGSAMIMGLPGNAAQPAPDEIGEGELRYVHLMHRHQLKLGEVVTDLNDPLFGTPSKFLIEVHGQQEIELHPSRVITFTGNMLPEGMLGAISDDWFWGDPLLASVFDALTSHDTGVAAIANLLNEAKVDIVHVPGFMDSLTSDEYERTLIERFTLATLLKSITNTLVLDGGDGSAESGEKWEQRQIRWEGLPDVQRTLFQLVSGAADIPATRLIGQAPVGMNATGESDIRNYYDMLASLQSSDMTPALAPLDERLIMSATGSRDPDIFYEWRPLWQMTPKEKAERDKMVAETANTYATMGAVPDDALAVAVQNRLIEDGVFPGLEAALDEAEQEAKLAIPPEERMAEFEGVEGQGPPQQPGQQKPPANSGRRAANDRARRAMRDNSWRREVGRGHGPFGDYDPDQPRDPRGTPTGGQWTHWGGSVVFEVAPDPTNKAALARWNSLTDAQKEQITEDLTDEFAPQVTERMGVEATVHDAIGGYMGEINPTRVLTVDGREFEVAGALGTLFDQKAMVVLTDGPGAGVEPVDAVFVKLGKVAPSDLRKVERELGAYASGGWTYQNGKLQLLNFSGTDNAAYAAEIDKRLGGRYRVEHTTIYSALVERESYVSPQSDREGSPWGQVAGDLRNAFTRRLDEEIEKAKGRQDRAQARGQVDYSPTQPRAPAGTPTGGQWIEAGGGIGWTGEHAEDLPPHIRKANEDAQQRVRELGLADGNEHLILVDQRTGQSVGEKIGEPTRVNLPPSMVAKIENPDNDIAIVHFHPYDVGLSTPDVAKLGSPGVRSITAITSDGSVYTAYRLPGSIGQNEFYERLAMTDINVDNLLYPNSARWVSHGLIDERQMNHAYPMIKWELAEKFGLLKHEARLKGGTKRTLREYEWLWTEARKGLETQLGTPPWQQ